MDFEQWRSHAKVPKLQLVDQQSPDVSGLALFTTHPNNSSSTINKTASTGGPSLLPFPDLSSTPPTGVPRMAGYFSLAQWQEMELQALIYKYMVAGIPVPMELTMPIRKSLLSGLPYYHHHPQQFDLAMLRNGYWARCAVDPEPGRCRRTDGKKWRCSREVVPGQKYCERHVHRGRNRSRKRVEFVPETTFNIISPPTSVVVRNTETSDSASSPRLGIALNHRPLDGKRFNGGNPQGYTFNFTAQEVQEDGGSDNPQVLRRFFDDWPKTQQESDNTSSNASSSTTNLSMPVPGNSPSDFSLKLSTGISNSDDTKPDMRNYCRDDEGLQQLNLIPNSWSAWGQNAMGGPLAEALRSSASTPSSSRVLQKQNGSVSEASSISV